ncbi:MAG TPA: META domain-containing protein, partial [Caldilineaceae bacterium]|nr:META domain-containing protein [Caldilineaceae bacterium]
AYWQAQFTELPAPSAPAPITGTVAKVSDMIGLGVRNPQGENIGEIADMIINVERQQLSAAVLAFRAFLFMGKETFVVPYAAFSLDVSSVDRRNPIGTPILNITQENLANAPPFNPKEVDLTDPNWSQPYQSWWQRMAQPPATGQGLLPLSMTAWVLESFGEPEDNLPVIPGTRPSVNFLVERYTGYGGCNWFLGVYTSGTDGSLRMQTPATSIPAVCEPAGVMGQETTFMSALLNVTEYQIEEGKLVGYTVQNQRMLTLSPAEPVPFDATLWTLRFFIQGTLGAPLIGGTAITAQFAGDQVSGSAGCNTYTATVVHDGDKLSFSDVKATEKTCSEPEGIMDQEAKFLADLASVATNVHLGGTLQMADSSGQPILLFGTDVQPSTP